MTTPITRRHPPVCVLLFILLTCSVMVITVAGHDNVSVALDPGPDLNITNHSIDNIGQSGRFVAGPTPITIIHAELNQSTLPGPRDMGFGPSIIDLSVAPHLLAVIFIIILIGLVLSFVWMRNHMVNPEEKAPKE